jgi:hypothetical protein
VRVPEREIADPPSCERLILPFDFLPPWLVSVVRDEGRLMLTDYETARLFGISRGSVRQAIAEQEIAVCRLGRRLLIPLIPLLEAAGLVVSYAEFAGRDD